MATVRITKDLTALVESNVMKLYTARIDEATNAVKEDWGYRLYNGMTRDFLHIVHQLPEGFLAVDGGTVISGVTVGGEEYAGPSRGFPFKEGGAEVPIPFTTLEDCALMGLRSYYVYRGSFNNAWIDGSDPRWGTLCEEIRDWRIKVDAVTEEQTTAVRDVRRVLGAFATLAPALKAWPALWDLLDGQTKNRHREIVSRGGRSTPALPDVDLEGITAAVVASKITGGNK